MKKGILCILLSIFLLVPLLTACGGETATTRTKAKVYTLYTIVDESTTDDAIRRVELSLNRILFYRLGVILDIRTAKSEEEYYKLVNGTLDELEANAEKGSTTTSNEIITGDDILAMLEKNEDIPYTSPRLDLFLVTDFQRYYDYAVNGDLTEIDAMLNNEGKDLTSEIHGTFFNAAKVNGKIYGVPVNSPIGENTYFVFDKELFESQDIVDITTIHSLKDLEEYFSVIKEMHPDVVPLKTLGANLETNFLINEGFPAIVNNGVVSDAYSNPKFNNYLSLVAKYNALGYIGNPATDAKNTKYAVRIETGNEADFDSEKEILVKYSNPIATTENTIESIFCISKYVSSNELIDIINIITALYTQSDLMNLMLYGVEGINYELDDHKQVHRLAGADGNYNYVIDPYCLPNPFIAYTLDTEARDKWEQIIAQNRETIASPSLGYMTTYMTWDYINEDFEPAKLMEPDYIAVVNEVVSKYYPNGLSDGSLITQKLEEQGFTYETLKSQCEADALAELTANLTAYYKDYVLAPSMRSDIEATIRTEQYDTIYAETEATVRQIAETHPNDPNFATEEAILAFIEAEVEKAITKEVTAQAKAAIDAIDVATIEAGVMALPEYQVMLKVDLPRVTDKNIDSLISEYLSEIITAMIEEINLALETEVQAFFDAHKDDISCETIEELYCVIGFYEKGEATEGEGSTEGDTSSEESESTDTSEGENEGETDAPSVVYNALYESWYEFVIEGKVTDSYNDSFESVA